MTKEKPESEQALEWWAEELIKLGYIKNITHQPREFILTPKQTFEYSEIKVTKRGVGTKEGSGFLLHDWTYKPDYAIEWNTSAYGLLYYNIKCGHNLKETIMCANSDVSWIECKPDYKFRKENLSFSHKQKAMYAIHGIYVNMVSIPKFFNKSFVPEPFLLTPITRELKAEYKRKMPRTVEEFIEMRLEWQRKKIG